VRKGRAAGFRKRGFGSQKAIRAIKLQIRPADIGLYFRGQGSQKANGTDLPAPDAGQYRCRTWSFSFRTVGGTIAQIC
jgi:hypothetical protein